MPLLQKESSDIQSWNETISELKQTKTITKDVDLNKVLNYNTSTNTTNKNRLPKLLKAPE